MEKISRRISAVALAGVCLTGLAMTGTAQAASYSSVQVRVCNGTDRDRVYVIEGQNQNGAWSRYDPRGVVIRARGGCHNGGWWWKTGQNVRIGTFPTQWNPDTDGWTSRGYILPADAWNGSTRTTWVQW